MQLRENLFAVCFKADESGILFALSDDKHTEIFEMMRLARYLENSGKFNYVTVLKLLIWEAQHAITHTDIVIGEPW
jgi:hypothetical protein